MTTDPAFWDNIADKYAAQPVQLPDAFDRKTEVTLSHLSPDATVLDVGCGTGSFALRLAPHVRAVHGLDYSPEMTRIAREKAADVPNTTFHTGVLDASFTALGDNTLDMVCAYSLLHLVRDTQDALQHMYRLIKPGGTFVSSTECLRESWIPFPPILFVMRLLGKAPHVQMLSISELMDELRQAGFVDVALIDVGAKATTAFIVAKKPN